jgi:DNA-directed RNA polymerase subunit F
MKLKATLTKEEHEALDASLRDLYAEKDGKFILDAEGVEDVTGLKSALKKERDAASAAQKTLKELQDKFTDLDPEKARDALEKLRALEDKTLLDAGKVDELVARKTERMKADHDNQLKALVKERDGWKGKAGGFEYQLQQTLLETQLRDAATKAGVTRTAFPDVILRAKQIFQPVDGKLVPMRDGQVVYGKDATQAMSVEEWLTALSNDAPHLFEKSAGDQAQNEPRTFGKNVRITRDQAHDVKAYRAAKAQAEKTGGLVEIVG